MVTRDHCHARVFGSVIIRDANKYHYVYCVYNPDSGVYSYAYVQCCLPIEGGLFLMPPSSIAQFYVLSELSYLHMCAVIIMKRCNAHRKENQQSLVAVGPLA